MSVVKLNKGGFEDVVVAINPELPEDPKIVDNIKVRWRLQSSNTFLTGSPVLI